MIVSTKDGLVGQTAPEGENAPAEGTSPSGNPEAIATSEPEQNSLSDNAPAEGTSPSGNPEAIVTSAPEQNSPTDNEANVESEEAVDYFSVCLPRDVKSGEGPFVVAIKNNNTFCEGSIIDVNWVLTSAYCLSSLVGSHFQVIAGAHYLVDPSKQDDSQIRTITNDTYILIHANYTNKANSEGSDGKQKFYSHNVGLIYVKNSFYFSGYVQPIPLPVKACLDDGHGKTYGWQLHKSLMLKTLDVKIIDSNNCKALWDDDSDIDSNHICTHIPGDKGPWLCNNDMGDVTSNNSVSYIDPTCGGNAGSAAVLVTPNGEVLVGVFNYADIDCGETVRPIVYTSTFAYIDWIQEEIEKFFERLRAAANKRKINALHPRHNGDESFLKIFSA
uniref:Peptidase S1 domain-containing protein n=1 Tax=Glossina austeni TaxID=7395 RepID=A0A1A9URK4_GLOAU